ncbi:DUF3923 family protein [Corynebacterium aurimucosum]|nr:DUF3923 family protein [Corynebacterium aurimucosum]
MKLSWALWWTVTLIEALSFIALSALLLVRAEDAAGAQQTTELRLLNVAILVFAYLVPFAMVKSWVVVYLFSNLGLVSWRWFRGHLGDKG